MMRGLGAWRAVSAGGTAGPRPQPGDDPRVPREQTFIMRIPEFLLVLVIENRLCPHTPRPADVDACHVAG